MTDETTQDVVSTDTNSEQPNVNISVEQILASILKTTGSINVALEDLIANYGSFTIAVNQREDKSVDFSLTPLSEVQQNDTVSEE